MIELILAVTLLAVGVLAVAATTVPLGRLIRRGDAQAASAAAAGAVIETLRAGGCATAAGSAAGHGLRIAWSATGSGALHELTVVATYPWGPGIRSDTFATTVGCSP